MTGSELEVIYGLFSFNPCSSGSYIMTSDNFVDCPVYSTGFNPCSSGSYIMTEEKVVKIIKRECFNPCSSGSYIMTD